MPAPRPTPARRFLGRLSLPERTFVADALRTETVGGVLLLLAAIAALLVGLAGMYFALAYSYVYINCAVLPTAGVLVVYAWDVAERTAAARAQFRREVETRRAYRAARAAEYGA